MIQETHSNIDILFFGTSRFAVPVLEALVTHGYRIAGVVTRPDERAGRKCLLTPPPVKVTAVAHGIPVFQPKKLDVRDFTEGKIPQADVFIVVAYGKIIPKAILDMPRLGALNIHPSLLPRWRGPAPIQYAILHGDAETGVTIMQMDEEMDHGPILASSKFQVLNSKFVYKELYDILARMGAELLLETLPRWLKGNITPIPQDESGATYSKILMRGDGRIDWKKSAREIERMTRAFHPWPGAWTIWTRDGTPLRVRIEEADAIDAPPQKGSAGHVWRDAGHPLLVRTGDGSLVIKKIGAEGRRVLGAEDFIRGYPAFLDTVLE
ncbi:MAG: methionyl-tRNA formyltransferase [Parcubacteria group bacterium Greene0714_36]|nr:MAG: methionyl-tRNA formyltransferase [Parcubacteria group bacterium Greene0714_36]